MVKIRLSIVNTEKSERIEEFCKCDLFSPFRGIKTGLYSEQKYAIVEEHDPILHRMSHRPRRLFHLVVVYISDYSVLNSHI